MDFTITQAFLAEHIIPNDTQEITAEVLNSAFQALMADIDAGMATLADDIAQAVVAAFGDTIGAAAENAAAAKDAADAAKSSADGAKSSADTAADNSSDAKEAALAAKESADLAKAAADTAADNSSDAKEAALAAKESADTAAENSLDAKDSAEAAASMSDDTLILVRNTLQPAVEGAKESADAANVQAGDVAAALAAILDGRVLPLPAGLCFGYSTLAELDLSGYTFADIDSRTNMYEMFAYCRNLRNLTLPAGFGAAVREAGQMFQGCRLLQSLELPAGFGAAITNGSGMFNGCTALTSLTLPAGFGALITGASSMFSGCVSLVTLTLPEGFRILNFGDRAFHNCTSLKTLSKFNCRGSLSVYNSFDYMFSGCSALENVGGFAGLLRNIGFSDSPRLTLQSVVNIVTEAAAVTAAQTLTFHANTYALAEADETEYSYDGNTYVGIIALANAKGWTIASA